MYLTYQGFPWWSFMRVTPNKGNTIDGDAKRHLLSTGCEALKSVRNVILGTNLHSLHSSNISQRRHIYAKDVQKRSACLHKRIQSSVKMYKMYVNITFEMSLNFT